MKKDLNTTVQGHLGDSVKRSTLDFGPGLDHRVVSLSLTLGSMPFKKKKTKKHYWTNYQNNYALGVIIHLQIKRDKVV